MSRVHTMPVVAPSKVVVHPIVLLSVVDHFNRIQKISNQRRVVGVLLGSWYKGTVDVATSFAGIVEIRRLIWSASADDLASPCSPRAAQHTQ